MARTPTCHTCAIPAATCQVRAGLQSAIAGLGITSLRHRCGAYRPAFAPGDAVKVQTIAWFLRDEDDPPPRCWFPGHFIQLVGQRALVFVPAGAVALDMDEIEFEPNSNGYLKVPLSRVASRDAATVDVRACRWCAGIPALGDPCGRDPNYTPSTQCLVAAREMGSRVAAPVEPQPREEISPSTQGRGVNKP